MPAKNGEDGRPSKWGALTGLSIIFGAGIGTVVYALTNLAGAMVIGAALGLVVGSILDARGSR